MKQIRYIMMLLVMVGFTACESDSIEGLSGEFKDVNFCDFTTATVQPTEKLGMGIKALNTTYTDNAGNTLTLRFGSKDWVLAEGTYILVPTLTEGGKYTGTINGAAISEGNVDVNLVGETYFVTGLLKTSDGKQYRVKYKGAMVFVVGEDDPEPTGYTMSIQTSSVEILDWTTWQTTTYPDVTKYTITVYDANGKQVALFDVINGNDKGADQLAGTYTIVGDAHDPMQISGGYSLPDYSMAGGTSYLDEAGKMQYLTGGTVEITTSTSADGKTLLSFKGSALETIDAAGVTGSGAFNLLFVSLDN